MERQNIKQHIDSYRQELRLAVHHPILNRELGEVELDSTKAFFLLLPLLNGEEWTESMNVAAVAIGVVHAAFDAHDAIELYDATSTQQQLRVLSGDYFSGVHYKLLASLPDVGFIHALSKTIGQINEMKTNFHNHSPNGPQEIRETIQMIEAGCIIQFFRSFGFSRYIPLVSAALPFLTMDPEAGRLAGRPTIQTVLGWKIEEKDADQVVAELSSTIDETINNADFLSPFLKVDIQDKTTSLLGKLI